MDFKTESYLFIDLFNRLIEESYKNTKLPGYLKIQKQIITLLQYHNNDEFQKIIELCKDIQMTIKSMNGDHYHIYILFRIINKMKKKIMLQEESQSNKKSKKRERERINFPRKLFL